jgi:hypothetical protein
MQKQGLFKRAESDGQLDKLAAFLRKEVELSIELGLDLSSCQSLISQFTNTPELGQSLKVVAYLIFRLRDGLDDTVSCPSPYFLFAQAKLAADLLDRVAGLDALKSFSLGCLGKRYDNAHVAPQKDRRNFFYAC